jgi:hypothetical protein
MSDINVKYFGNGKHRINTNLLHAIKTKEYHDLTSRCGTKKLPANKMYVAHKWVDDVDGSFATIRIGEKAYVDINTKCIDYIHPLRRRDDT